jgi:hypothetical protein
MLFRYDAKRRIFDLVSPLQGLSYDSPLDARALSARAGQSFHSGAMAARLVDRFPGLALRFLALSALRLAQRAEGTLRPVE